MTTARFFGDNGFVKCLPAASAPVDDYYGIIVYSDITITSAIFQEGYPVVTGLLNGVTLPKGTYPMRLKSLAISSGACLVYKNQ
jgi:hypothetical protein